MLGVGLIRSLTVMKPMIKNTLAINIDGKITDAQSIEMFGEGGGIEVIVLTALGVFVIDIIGITDTIGKDKLIPLPVVGMLVTQLLVRERPLDVLSIKLLLIIIATAFVTKVKN